MVKKCEGILPITKSSLTRSYILDHKFIDWINPDDGISGWKLPGHGESRESCGTFYTRGCLEVDKHTQPKIDRDVVGKVYIKKIKSSCGKAECPICYEKWAGKEAHRIEYRLKQFRTKAKIIHLMVSPPSRLWGIDPSILRRKSYLISKNVNFMGGCCVFHPFRMEESSNRPYFSPHFHMLGYGWIQGVSENYERSGWIVKNLGVRKSVVGTAQYQLSHCGVHEKYHSVTWFGWLSYNKLRVKPEKIEVEKCPLCGGEIHHVSYDDVRDPLPDVEDEYFVEKKGWFYNGKERARYW